MGYGHLTINEREVILKMRSQQATLSKIGKKLGYNKGTISRELSRNISSTGEYKPHLAQRYYNKRRDGSKHPYRLEQYGRLRRYVCNKLKQYFSPEQIVGRIEIDYPDDPQMRISCLTIYSWIQRDKKAGGKLYKFLRHSHRKRRKKHGSQDARGQIPERRPISERSEVVDNREELGRRSARRSFRSMPGTWPRTTNLTANRYGMPNCCSGWSGAVGGSSRFAWICPRRPIYSKAYRRPPSGCLTMNTSLKAIHVTWG